jgi:hypothetical protein
MGSDLGFSLSSFSDESFESSGAIPFLQEWYVGRSIVTEQGETPVNHKRG